jgi:hypothetical protein
MKTIVILRPVAGVGIERIAPLLVAEEKKLWSYMVKGNCREIYYNVATFGSVILIFETATAEDCASMVSAFPLVDGGVFDVEYLPCEHYTGVAHLFAAEHGLSASLPTTWVKPPSQ